MVLTELAALKIGDQRAVVQKMIVASVSTRGLIQTLNLVL